MMKPIKDYENKVVCHADELTGRIESKNKKQKTSTCLPIGGEVVFERERTKTVVRRKSEHELEVLRYLAA